MRTRPRENRRRGLLRAALAIVVLIVLLLVALLVVSSLTAPPAKAPIVPVSPGRATVPPATQIPASPRPTGTATHKAKKKAISLAPTGHGTSTAGRASAAAVGDASSARRFSFAQRVDRTVLSEALSGVRSWPVDAVRSPDGKLLAYFGPGRDPYRGSTLYLRTTSDKALPIGVGDPLIRPVWSGNAGLLAYVRARPTPTFPGTRWSLLEFDRRSGKTIAVGVWNAMNVTPLGWARSSLLAMVANSTDTAIYTNVGSRRPQATIMMSQPLVTAFLSPDAHYIAFGAPTNCAGCNLDIFYLDQQRVWGGPTGLPDETTIAWTRGGRSLIVRVGSRLLAIDPESHAVQRFPLPAGTPRRWVHPMVASVSGRRIVLQDSVTGVTFGSAKP